MACSTPLFRKARNCSCGFHSRRRSKKQIHGWKLEKESWDPLEASSRNNRECKPELFDWMKWLFFTWIWLIAAEFPENPQDTFYASSLIPQRFYFQSRELQFCMYCAIPACYSESVSNCYICWIKYGASRAEVKYKNRYRSETRTPGPLNTLLYGLFNVDLIWWLQVHFPDYLRAASHWQTVQ